MDWPRSIGISCSNLKGYYVTQQTYKQIFIWILWIFQNPIKGFHHGYPKNAKKNSHGTYFESKDNVTYIIRCNL
jgi:hypothetical protein